MLECVGCPASDFESKHDLEAHVAAIHFNYLPYECEKCRFAKFPTEYAIRYHWEFEHQISEYCIRYRISPELIAKRQEIVDYVQQCVDRQPTTTNTTTTTSSSNIDSAFDTEQIEEKPVINPESSITESSGNFPASSLSPTLKDLLKTSELASETRLGDAIKKMKKRKRHNITSFQVPISMVSAPTSIISESTSNYVGGNPATVECTECKRIIANQATSVMYHTNSRHLQLPVFTCTPCKRIWTTISRSDLLKHVKNFHNNDMSVIIDKKDEYVKLIKQKCRELFPNRGAMISKRRCYGSSPNGFAEDGIDGEQDD